jgi:hypothetical protein
MTEDLRPDIITNKLKILLRMSLVLTGYRSVGVRVAGVPHGAVFSQKQ